MQEYTLEYVFVRSANSRLTLNPRNSLYRRYNQTGGFHILFASLPPIEYANRHRQYMLPLTSANIGDSQRVPKNCIGCTICPFQFFFWGGGAGFYWLYFSLWAIVLADTVACCVYSTHFERWLFSVDYQTFMSVPCGVRGGSGRDGQRQKTSLLEYNKKYVYTQSTSVYLSPRPNYDPYPLSPQQVGPPPEPKGGTHSPAGEGGPNLDDQRKILALCLLCGVLYVQQPLALKFISRSVKVRPKKLKIMKLVLFSYEIIRLSVIRTFFRRRSLKIFRSAEKRDSMGNIFYRPFWTGASKGPC